MYSFKVHMNPILINSMFKKYLMVNKIRETNDKHTNYMKLVKEIVSKTVTYKKSNSMKRGQSDLKKLSITLRSAHFFPFHFATTVPPQMSPRAVPHARRATSALQAGHRLVKT